MDDGICERQVLSVLNLNLTAFHHSVQLLLNLVWNIYQKNEKLRQIRHHYHKGYKPVESFSPCIFGYFAIKSRAHLSVAAVVSVPAVNRFIIVTKMFAL